MQDSFRISFIRAKEVCVCVGVGVCGGVCVVLEADHSLKIKRRTGKLLITVDIYHSHISGWYNL